MNSCILMVEIIQDPQLRYTADTQTEIAEMLVQFSGLKAEDPPATLKVVGWGNLAQKINSTYHAGDRAIVEGRLSMNTIERPEGFKEKRAELTASRIHSLDAAAIGTSGSPISEIATPAPATSNVVPLTGRRQETVAAGRTNLPSKPEDYSSVSDASPAQQYRSTPANSPQQPSPFSTTDYETTYSESDGGNEDDIPF